MRAVRPLRAELQAEVAQLIAEAKVPALMVTHDPDEAQALATRIVRLAAGRSVGDAGHNAPGQSGDVVHGR